MNICPNKSNKLVMKEFNELVELFGLDEAYFLWDKNGGYGLDKNPDGNLSEQFSDVQSDKERIALLKLRRDDIVILSYLNQTEPLIDYIGENNEETIKGELGVDKAKLISLLGSTMYKLDVLTTAVKELLQNAFDAVKIAKSLGKIEEAKIHITLNKDDRTITVEDNGMGMSPDIVQKAFFTIGGSYKGDNVDNRLKSGGLGLAKMAFLFSSDYVEVSTVKDGVKTYSKTTPENIENSNFTITTSKTLEPNGTKVVVKIPETYTTASGEERTIWFNTTPSFLDKPMIGDVTLEVTKISSSGWGDKETTEKDYKGGIPDGYSYVGKATSAFGDVEIYVAPDNGGSYILTQVLISGLYQFGNSIYNNNGTARLKAIINILPTVGVTDLLYPINNQREGYRSTVEPEVEDLGFLIKRINKALERKSVSQMFANTVSMDVKKVADVTREAPKENLLENVVKEIRKQFQPKESPTKNSSNNTGVELVWKLIRELKDNEKSRKSSFDASGIKIDDDNTSVVDTSNLDISKPIFHNNTTMILGDDAQKVLSEIGQLLLELKSLYILTYEKLPIQTRHNSNIVDFIKTQYWGFSFDKNYGGVNVNPSIFNFLAINPFYKIPEMQNVDIALALTEYITHLIIHEFNHNYASGEGAEFTGRFPLTYAEFAGIGKEFNKDWKNKLYKVIRDNINVFIKYEAEYKSASNRGESLREDRLQYSSTEETSEGEESSVENDGTNSIGRIGKEDVHSYGEELKPLFDAINKEKEQERKDRINSDFMFLLGEEKHQHREENLEKLKHYYVNSDILAEHNSVGAKWARGVSRAKTKAFNNSYGQNKKIKARVYLDELKKWYLNNPYKYLFGLPYMFLNKSGAWIVTIPAKPEEDILKSVLDQLDELSDDVIYSELLRIEQELSLDFMYYISPKKYPGIREKLHWRISFFNSTQIDEAVDFLEELENNKENNAYVDCCLKWLKNGTILLPRDNEIVRKAFDFARLKHIDTQSCKSPLDIYSKYIESKSIKLENIQVDMSNYSHMHFNRSEITRDGVKVDIYDVDNTTEGQQQVCLILADTNPKDVTGRPIDFSPWCLSTFNVSIDGKATPTNSAKNYWSTYDSETKQIAIVNGRPVAFNANHQMYMHAPKFDRFNVEYDINADGEYVPVIRFSNHGLLPNELEKAVIDTLINLGKIYDSHAGHEHIWGHKYIVKPEFINEIVEKDSNSWWDYHDISPVDDISDIDINYAEQSLKTRVSSFELTHADFGAYGVDINSSGDVVNIHYRADNIYISILPSVYNPHSENNINLSISSISHSHNIPSVEIYQEADFFGFGIISRPFGFSGKRANAYMRVVNQLEQIIKGSLSIRSTNHITDVGIDEDRISLLEDKIRKLSVFINDIKMQMPFNLQRIAPALNEVYGDVVSILKDAENYIQTNVSLSPTQNRSTGNRTNSDREYDLDDPGEKFWRDVQDANERAWLQSQGLDYLLDFPEISIEPYVTDFVMRDYMWDRYSQLIEKPMNKLLADILHNILKKFHFEIIEGDLRDIFGENVLGSFDYLQKIIYLAQEKNRNAITDAEEFSHAFIKMMGARYRKQENRDKFPENKLYSELRDLLEGTYFYAQVYDLYKNVYKYPNGLPDTSKIKEEALGKALAVALNDAIDRYNDEKSKTFFQKLKVWFDKVIHWIRTRIGGVENTDNNLKTLLTELDKIADDIINGTYFKKYLKKINDRGYKRVGYQKSMKYAESIGRGDMIALMRDMSDLGGIVSGSISYRLQGILKRPRLDTLHDIDISFPLSAHGLHTRHPQRPEVYPSMFYIGLDNVWEGYALIQELDNNPQTHRILETLRLRPGFNIISAFMADTNVITNCMLCEDSSIVERFKNMTGNFNTRLQNFTKEERDKITLIDLFFNSDNAVDLDYIEDNQRSIKLANYRHSFKEKLKFARAKDLYDYQQFEPEHRFYKTSNESQSADAPHLTTEQFMYQLGNLLQRAINLSEKIAGQFNALYRKYEKMPNKSAARQKILDQVFEKFNELQQAEDYEAVTSALEFAVKHIGIWDNTTNNPQSLNTILSYLYSQKNLAEPYSGVTPLILIDMYKNSISFYDDLIHRFIPNKTDLNLTKEDRLNIDVVESSIAITKQMWLEALVVVGDKIVDKNIDDWVHETKQNRENMKIVAKDYLHKNIMYGDTWSIYSTFLNNGFSNSPIIKQAFHLILIAETKKLEELNPIRDRLMKVFARTNTAMRKVKSGFGNWLEVFMERNRDGIFTGNFVQPINYGQYKEDLSSFVEALNDRFETDYGHFYVVDENGVVVNSLTGERADKEEWGSNGEQPVYIKYQLAIDKWKCDHSNRRYTYKYYSERLSRPYKGSIDPNEATNPSGHGLSPDTLFIYDHIQSNINYYLDKCTDKNTGMPHPERLSKEDKKSLRMWQQRLDDFSNPYNEDLTPKTDNSRRMAFEVRAWLNWLGKQTTTTINIDEYEKELNKAKEESIKNGDPSIYEDFIRFNSRVGINPEYLNYVFGYNKRNKRLPYDVQHAELIKRSLLGMVRSTGSEYTRDLEKYINNPEFWARCRNVDLIIEDGRDLVEDEESENGIPIEFDEYFEYKSIIYKDANGLAYDNFGHQIPIGQEKNRDDLLTFYDWIVNNYTNKILANSNRTLPGVHDGSGNLYVFTGDANDVRDKVRMLFTFNKRYIDDEGNVVVKRIPLTIFKMLTPTKNEFLNPRTGNMEPTIMNVPNGRFSKKSDSWGEYYNNMYKEDDLNAEQPKAYDDNGNDLYINHQWNKIEKDNNLRALYNELINVMQYAQDAYSSLNRRFNYALPAIEASTMQLLSRIRQLGIGNTYNSIKENLTSVRWNDQDTRRRNQYIRDFDGSVADDVPLRFVGTLDNPSEYTTDVVGAVVEFLDMALNYKYKSNIDATLKTLLYNMDDSFRQQMQSNDESMEYVNNPNYSKLMLSMLNMHMYNNQWAEDPSEAPSTRNQVFWNKVSRKIQAMDRLHMLAFNFLSMVTGGGDAVSRILKESINSKYFTFRDFIRSFASVLRYTPQCIANISNPVANNKLTKAMHLNGVSKDTHAIHEHGNRSRVFKLLTDLGMKGFSLIDWMVNALLLRMAYNNRRLYDGGIIPTGFYSLYELLRAFVDAGKSKYAAIKAHMFSKTTLWHAYDKNMVLKPEFSKEFNDDGTPNPDFICHVSDNTKTEVRTSTFLRGGLINGMNPDNDKPGSKFTNIGNAITALRGWMFQVYQHLMVGREENVVKNFDEKESYDTKRRPGKTLRRSSIIENPMTTELRNSRLSYNYETGTSNDAVYRNMASSIKTLWRKIVRWGLLRNVRFKGTKLTYSEKYAWRSAVVYMSVLIALMLAWPYLNEEAKNIPRPTTRSQAGPTSIWDIPRWVEREYIGNELWKLLAADVGFRIIESQITSIDPTSAMETVKQATVLYSAVKEQSSIINAVGDVTGFSGHQLSEKNKTGSYLFYTRGERDMYKLLGFLDNWHTSFTYNGLRWNLKFYTDTYGGIYRWMGYDFSWNKKKNNDLLLGLDLDLDLGLDLDLDLGM